MLPISHYRESEIHAFILFLILSNGFALESFENSVLLRKLTRGYERLPPTGSGPVTVELGIYINYFYDISEQTMDYSINLYLRQRWNDSRLQFNISENNNNPRLKVGHGDLRDLWIPDVFITNEKSASFHYVTTDNKLLYIENQGTLWYVLKITATLSCPMRLYKYPMDTQRCPLYFESFGYTSEEVHLKWFDLPKDAIQFDNTGKSMPQFIIDDTNFDLTDCSYNGTKVSADVFTSSPCLRATFIMTRNLGYYMIQYYIPSILLVILSWVGFWISVDAVVARVSIGLLTVLSLTMQSTGSRNQLPQVSYIKAIDVWMSVSLAFAFGSLLEFAIVNVWSRKEVKVRSNIHANPSGAGSSVVSSSDVTQTSSRTKTKGSEQETEVKMDQIEPQPIGRRPSQGLSRRLSKQLIQRHVKRAQNIDSLSRKLFPLTFVCFNIIYWFFYFFDNMD